MENLQYMISSMDYKIIIVLILLISAFALAGAVYLFSDNGTKNRKKRSDKQLENRLNITNRTVHTNGFKFYITVYKHYVSVESKHIPEDFLPFNFNMNKILLNRELIRKKHKDKYYIKTWDKLFDNNIKFLFKIKFKGLLLLSNDIREEILKFNTNSMALSINDNSVILNIDLLKEKITEQELKKRINILSQTVISLNSHFKEGQTKQEISLIKTAFENEVNPETLKQIINLSKKHINKPDLKTALENRIPNENSKITDIALYNTGSEGKRRLKKWFRKEYRKSPDILCESAFKSLRIFKYNEIKDILNFLYKSSGSDVEKIYILNQMDKYKMNKLTIPCQKLLDSDNFSVKKRALELITKHGDADTVYILYSILKKNRLSEITDEIRNSISILEARFSIKDTGGRLSVTEQINEHGDLSISRENSEFSIKEE
jgi:hypothetical protein